MQTLGSTRANNPDIHGSRELPGGLTDFFEERGLPRIMSV
jgi:hypothetical protein